jgi:aryl-alcohol dehydrogenase-like predicted oxidoreductase
MASTFPSEHIIKCVEDSLRSLQTDSLEVVLFHVWRDIFNDEDEWKDVCKKLTKEGKVQHWGISPNYFEPEECINTLEEGFISVVQCMFHIFHQKPIKTLFPIALKNDVGIVACAPLDEGGLTGTIDLKTVFEPGDFRSEYFKGDRLIELVKRTDLLKKVLRKYNIESLPELALRFILSFEEVSSVIPGMRKMKNLESNVLLSDGKSLNKDLLKELELHSWERNFYPWAQ